MVPERAPYSGQSYKLFDDYNDIHIFVEDAGFENLYVELFKKYGVGVENIFSRNGKDEVLKEAESCTDTKCVFIVDRDWDDLLGTMSTLKNVLVLNMYSIECYLIDHEAFSGIIAAECPRCNIDDLLSKEDFKQILTDVSDELRLLFECFVATQMSDKNIKWPEPGAFQQRNRSCAPDRRKIAKFISDSGVTTPQSVKDYFSAEVLTDVGHGKFMLHYVWEGVRRRLQIRKKVGKESLMIRLAQLLNTMEIKELISEVKERALAC